MVEVEAVRRRQARDDAPVRAAASVIVNIVISEETVTLSAQVQYENKSEYYCCYKFFHFIIFFKSTRPQDYKTTSCLLSCSLVDMLSL